MLARAADHVAQPVVIKIGGGLLDLPDRGPFWDGVQALMARGPVVMVHGGGPQATGLARRLGHEPRFVHGRRVTTDTDLAILQWTARGELSTRLTREAFARGIRAVGLSGVDGGIVQVERRPPWTIDGEEVDFGWVGDIQAVDTTLLTTCLDAGFLPIVSPLGVDAAGQAYNINADTVARHLAVALGAVELLLVTETGSLRRGTTPDAPPVPECDGRLFEDGITTGWIGGGMRVKLQVALDAASAGIGSVWVVGYDDLPDRARATRVRP